MCSGTSSLKQDGLLLHRKRHAYVQPLDMHSGVLGGIRGYTAYTNLRVFLTAYTHLRVAQLVECLVTSGYPDGSSSGGPGENENFWKIPRIT